MYKKRFKDKKVKDFNSKIDFQAPMKIRGNDIIPVGKDKDGNVVLRLKVHLFLEELLNNGGNITQAALKITKSKNRNAASIMGWRLMKQAKNLGMLYLDEKGITYGTLLDEAVKKMKKSRTPEWWDRLMKIAGYIEEKPNVSSSVAVNIFQTQERLRRKFGFSSEDIVESEELEGDILEDGPNEKI